MKNLILLFVIAVALTSAIVSNAGARQNLVNAPIERATYFADSSVVQLDGHLSTPCSEKPHPTLNIDEKSDALVLSVSSIQIQDLCMALIGQRYEMAFDIRALKMELQKLNLNSDAQYRIITQNGDLDITVDFSGEDNGFPFSSEEIEGGMIERTLNGDIQITNETSSLTLSSPFIDAEKYIGAKVSLSGHIVNMSLVSSPFANTIGQSEPLFIVTGIHTASAL